MAVLFVDVSHHDRNRRGSALDWAAIATSTGQGEVMTARASYGDPAGFSPPSPYFAEHMAGAAAAGYSCRGGYHNLIHGDAASVARQIDYLRRELDRGGCVFGMADIEPYEELKANGLWPRWADVLRWRDRWAQVEDRVMVWYLGRWVWRDWLGQPDLHELPGPLINAHYAGGDGTPTQIYAAAGGDSAAGWAGYGNRVPDILQYTADANVTGASGRTDVNAYRGTLAALTDLLGGAMPTVEEIVHGVWTARVRDSRGREYSANGGHIDTVMAARDLAERQVPALARDLTDLKAAVELNRAAIEALAQAGGADVAPVLTRIDTVRAELLAAHDAQTATLQAELAEARAELEQLHAARAAAAKAEADALADQPEQ